MDSAMLIGDIENGETYVGHDGARRFVDSVDANGDGVVEVSFMCERLGGRVETLPLPEFLAWRSPASAFGACS